MGDGVTPLDPTPDPQKGFRCRCIWQNFRCTKEATQEDGCCDWCAETRTGEDMVDNPFAQYAPDGTYLGLAGGTVTGYIHQAGWGEIPDNVRPTACWMLGSGRVLGRG